MSFYLREAKDLPIEVSKYTDPEDLATDLDNLFDEPFEDIPDDRATKDVMYNVMLQSAMQEVVWLEVANKLMYGDPQATQAYLPPERNPITT